MSEAILAEKGSRKHVQQNLLQHLHINYVRMVFEATVLGSMSSHFRRHSGASKYQDDG